MRRVLSIAVLLGALPAAVAAQDFQLHGYADARLQVTDADAASWIEGGTAKQRFDANESALQFGGATLVASWQVSPELLAIATVQLHPQTSPSLGLLDAYLRYRPVSTTPWRWSARIGAFFPPVSLENDGVGWTSRWTLTPSAINSWVGEELRTFGAEFRIERRGSSGTLDFGVAGFKHNDPAGELLASRGWAMSDIASTLNSCLRQPDAYASVVRTSVPVRFEPFAENDGHIGWHADISWRGTNGGRLALLRYDNRADPQSFGVQGTRHVYSWRTRFWSLGAELPLGKFLLTGQLMDGSTAFEPRPGLLLDSKFHAGYLLAGWDQGAWRPALRFDMFSVRRLPNSPAAPLSEHGHAWTAALNWRPRPWLRLTGELLRIDSVRNQRSLEGLSPRQVDTQLQLSLRLLF